MSENQKKCPGYPVPAPEFVEELLAVAKASDEPLAMLYDPESGLLVSIAVDPQTKEPTRWSITGPLSADEAFQAGRGLWSTYEAGIASAAEFERCH